MNLQWRPHARPHTTQVRWLLLNLGAAEPADTYRATHFRSPAGKAVHGYVMREGFTWSGCWWDYMRGWVVLPPTPSAKAARREVLLRVRAHAAERALRR